MICIDPAPSPQIRPFAPAPMDLPLLFARRYLFASRTAAGRSTNAINISIRDGEAVPAAH